MPKREVEQQNVRTKQYSLGVPALAGPSRLKAELRTFSKSETVWFATLTTRTKRVGTMPYFLQAEENADNADERLISNSSDYFCSLQLILNINKFLLNFVREFNPRNSF